jgi:acetyl esterase/lipase
MEMTMGRLPLAEGVTATSLDADGVAVVSCVRHGGSGDPAVLYFHGGGYRLGSATSYRSYGSHLARACSAQVLLVDYRLAPEHPFPAAVDDALVAYRWLLADERLAARVVIGGDSAGGGLAAALALRARDEGLPLPAGVVCLSPWADLTNSAGSYGRCAESDALFSKASADEAAGLYLNGTDAVNPLASPVRGDWVGLPPLLIQASECEVLVDDATGLAANAGRAGVDVELHLYPDMPHVWQMHYPLFPEAVQAVDQVRDFVVRVTSPGS